MVKRDPKIEDSTEAATVCFQSHGASGRAACSVAQGRQPRHSAWASSPIDGEHAAPASPQQRAADACNGLLVSDLQPLGTGGLSTGAGGYGVGFMIKDAG